MNHIAVGDRMQSFGPGFKGGKNHLEQNGTNNGRFFFSNGDVSESKRIREAYLKIMNIFSQEIGFQENIVHMTGRISKDKR